MEETVEFASPDSSLKKYFKYMVTNRNVSIQFSARKIKDIIETDLQINLLAHQSIYARVCTEAFAYYIQTWPEWYSNNDYQYSEVGYERLKEYLKTKLMNLKKIEKVLSKKNTTVRSVEKPSDSDTFRYELHISLPNDIFGPNNELAMKHGAEDTILLQLNPCSGNLDFTLHHIFHYPFISVEFRLPGLIQIKRSCPFKYEQFLFKYDDSNVPTLDNTHIRSIDYDDKQRCQPKVFTYNLMSVFFTQLKMFLAECPQVSDLKRLEIQSLCDAFLDDISETNLALSTVCERAVVNYNIGRKQYYVDRDCCGNDIFKSNERTVHRIVWTPIVSYCLDFFSITQENVDFDGIDYFKFTKNPDKSFETIFMQYINSSLTYKCVLCELNFNIDALKNHLITVHPISKAMKCITCQQIFLTRSLLCDYWKHKCVIEIGEK